MAIEHFSKIYTVLSLTPKESLITNCILSSTDSQTSMDYHLGCLNLSINESIKLYVYPDEISEELIDENIKYLVKGMVYEINNKTIKVGVAGMLVEIEGVEEEKFEVSKFVKIGVEKLE